MAAVVSNMGEVDDIHLKDEDAVLNGNSSDNDTDSQKSTSLKRVNEMKNSQDLDNDNSNENQSDHETENNIEENANKTESLANGNGDSLPDSPCEEVKEINEDSNSQDKEENSQESDKTSQGENVIFDSCEEVHEIDDDDDDEDDDDVIIENSCENELKKVPIQETIELNDSGGEENEETSPQTKDKPVVINLTTPDKKEPAPKKTTSTPRRSSRNINKMKSYVEIEKEDTPPPPKNLSEESDIEEILPEDPLANIGDSIQIEKIPIKKKIGNDASTIVVKDTKRLVEIATKSNSPSSSGKKEPTLVIIDTNSILSGKGPVPVNKSSPSTLPSGSTMYPVLPMALPAQGLYPANMRATITPIPMNQASSKSQNQTGQQSSSAPLLPSLTDDMFVVEAPSFIVPYVYEKPPVKDLKGFVSDYLKEVKKELESRKDEDDSNDGEEKEESDKKTACDESDGKDQVEEIKDSEKMDVDKNDDDSNDPSKPSGYFNSPLGKFFIGIGLGLVQEFVQTDLLKQQKRKRDRESGKNAETIKTIASLSKNLQYTKENNDPYRLEYKKCEFCPFKTDSLLAMSHHLETPHLKNFIYKCNFCPYEIRSPHDILFHMEAEHMVRGRLERALSYHQCPSCPFEDNQKSKLSRHLMACTKKFKPERNLEPPIDWEPPAKIPRAPKIRQGLTNTAYQALTKNSHFQLLSKLNMHPNNVVNRGRGRGTSISPSMKGQTMIRPSMAASAASMMYKQSVGGGSVLLPSNYQMGGNQVYQSSQHSSSPKNKTMNTPSISITPLPRVSNSNSNSTASVQAAKPGDTSSKNSFVICEICDGYIKDLEQLRNHMQWIHKVKIHPKMIYNRPPLNCQKCQFRFFTDQGLERHLLGSHGLVTSSMQDAANRSKDAGRCPVCGRVYQWKLLNHVARDHNMTLKPAHLSYKCTVCTATFGMYKQFENHVYSAHSVVAKRVMDKKGSSSGASSSNNSLSKSTDQTLKPLKINDEITIIPQPAKQIKDENGSKASSSKSR